MPTEMSTLKGEDLHRFGCEAHDRFGIDADSHRTDRRQNQCQKQWSIIMGFGQTRSPDG